jgi:hypothetical protein
MRPYEQITVRAAAIIHEQLGRRRLAEADVYLPHHAWSTVAELLRKRDLARGRGWNRAAIKLSEDLRWHLTNLRDQLDRVREALDQNARLQPSPSYATLCAEIAALSEEFEDVTIDLKRRQLSVTTEPVELDEQYLGPFQIQLNLSKFSSTPCYEVIALDPRPAATNSDVTHPHVQNGRLCEGDGHLAIQTALAEGRLMDFFLIVSRLLMTYARGSAYVELSDWDGESCADCGDTVSSSRSYRCDDCGSSVCGDCRESCSGCEAVLCRNCISSCDRCDELYCAQCLSACDKCQKQCCNSCLQDAVCEPCRTTTTSPTTSPGNEHDDATILDAPASPSALSAA